MRDLSRVRYANKFFVANKEKPRHKFDAKIKENKHLL